MGSDQHSFQGCAALIQGIVVGKNTEISSRYMVLMKSYKMAIQLVP